MTLILGLFISKLISTPLKNICKEAVHLPFGKYDSAKVPLRVEEYRELNDTLQNANSQIQKVDSMRNELLANVSHDLRTPLTMIIGYAEMIKDFKNEDPSDNVEVIVSEARRLSVLVDDILDVTKIENEGLKLNSQEYEINELLEETYHQYRIYCQQKNIHFEFDSSIDNLRSDFDYHRLQQVLYNFLNNAINYNDKETKKIRLKAYQKGDNARIEVYDNGNGIAENDIPFIWNRYYKVDIEHQRSHIGSGIGLSLAKSILEAHQLNYGVESELGSYSLFWFELPLS